MCRRLTGGSHDRRWHSSSSVGLSSSADYAVCDTPGCLARCTPIVERRPDPTKKPAVVNAWGQITVTPAEEIVALPPAGWLVESLYRSVPGIPIGERTGEAWRCPAHAG